MLQIQNALGILSSQVPTGNLLWVDAVNGVDQLASRGRLTIPFKTLTAAKNAAKSGDANTPGDTIIVLPGKYEEKNLLKDYVNWHFLPGAVVSIPSSDNSNGGIFDTGSDGSNGTVRSSITGHGVFSIANTNSSGCVVNSSASNSDIYIEALRMFSLTGPCIRSTSASDVLRIRVQRRLESSAADAIAITGASQNIFVEAELIHSSGGRGVYVAGGGVTVKAHGIYASADPAIQIEAGTSVIQAYEIKSDTDYGLLYDSSASALVTVSGARIVSGTTAAVFNYSSTDDAIKLHNCVLIAGGTYSIDASASGTKVHALGVLSSNKNPHSNITGITLSQVDAAYA